jgi:hypothetical protein
MGKILVIFVLFFLTCDTDYSGRSLTEIEPWGKSPYQTIVIDSCEYVYVFNGNASWGSHKGNCKFCAERLKNKIIQYGDLEAGSYRPGQRNETLKAVYELHL